MELPYTFQNLNVGRHGNLIVLDDGMGLKVTVDLPHDLIVIGLSGWYFGRSGGLLGSYDNERTNDLITAGKEKTSDIGDFVKSWEVANSCRSQRNLAPTIDVIEGSDRDETCAAFFKDQGSPLRPCFGQVIISYPKQISFCSSTLMKKTCYVFYPFLFLCQSHF